MYLVSYHIISCTWYHIISYHAPGIISYHIMYPLSGDRRNIFFNIYVPKVPVFSGQRWWHFLVCGEVIVGEVVICVNVFHLGGEV